MVRSAKIFLEFFNKVTDKGLALEILAKHLNIDITETMAIGDAGNDYSMINIAHIGVAMDNAYQSIKDIATYITDDNENAGVAKAINKYVFNK